MKQIKRLSATVVWRDVVLCWFAIGLAMAALAGDPALAFRTGALLAAGLTLVMEVKARIYHRIVDLAEHEVWRVLDDRERPPEPLARALVIIAMRRQLQAKAALSAGLALGLLFLAMGARTLAGS